jgi:hypothetical protein
MGLLKLAFTRVPKDHDLLSPRRSSRKAALAFVHIPKTAGTWFAHFLRQHFTAAEIATPLYDVPETTDFSDPAKRFFTGHFRTLAIDAKRPMRLVTFLRDPFQRTASHYRSWRFNEISREAVNDETAKAMDWVQQASYEDFVFSKNPTIEGSIRNIQTAYLSSFPNHNHPDFLKSAIGNLEDKFFFIGLQEFTRESLQLFKYQTGSTTEPEFSTLNVSERYDVTLSEAGRQRLQELLHNDILVYQAAQRLFERRQAAMSGWFRKVA